MGEARRRKLAGDPPKQEKRPKRGRRIVIDPMNGLTISMALLANVKRKR